MEWKRFFRPTMGKILLPLIIYVVGLVVLYRGMFDRISIWSIASIIFSGFLTVLVYYPFFCSILFIYENYKKDKCRGLMKKRKDLYVSVLLIVFNPVTIGIIYSLIWNFYMSVYYFPCGIEIADFTETSPAREAGILVGEVIVAVDGQPVAILSTLKNVLTARKPGQELFLQTDVKTYKITLAENPSTGEAVLGVMLRQKVCKK